MKPDIRPRPVSILTRAILDTAPAWVLLTAGNGYIYPSTGLRLDGALLLAPDGLCFFDHQRCYPCKADAPFEPIPWAVVGGEEEIEGWKGFTGEPSRLWRAGSQHDFIAWVIPGYPSLNARPGLHPASRRQINPDGTETHVWVWEADR